MINWTIESEILAKIQQMIRDFDQMDDAQSEKHYKMLIRDQETLLPGKLGSTFLLILDGAWKGADDIYSDLLKDVCNIRKIIKKLDGEDVFVWDRMYQELAAQPDLYFSTALGGAFIVGLADKLQAGKTEDKKTAAATQEEDTGRSNKKKWYRYAVKAAAAVLACMSVCFFGIWIYGQAERIQNAWEIQQMKSDALSSISVEEDAAGTKGQEEKYSAAVPEQRKDDSIQKDVRDLEGLQPDILPQYRKMSKKYPELYGWLEIPGTDIIMPVMRSEGDKDFYLYHDHTGKETVEGTLFVDKGSSSYPQDDNTVIYGHNMKNGHMFGMLKQYGIPEFFMAHKEIKFDTIYETGTYEAVAVLKARILEGEEEGFRYYQFFQYEDKAAFKECKEFIAENQIFDTGGSLKYGDKILMLSTCEYSQENGRLVVVARRL